jgi:DNA-binding protein H-NS
MKDSDLEKMSHDALWDLHQRIVEVLSRRLEDETRKLQKQLDELGRKSGKSPEELLERRPYPKVQPKFRNPENPAETWSGRGKMPRWLVELIESGRNRDEFKVR